MPWSNAASLELEVTHWSCTGPGVGQCSKSVEKQREQSHKRKRDGRRIPVIMKPLLMTRAMVPLRGDLGNLAPRAARDQWKEME